MPVRFEPAPLMQKAARRLNSENPSIAVTKAALAATVGVSLRTIRRWATEGTKITSTKLADKYACQIGLHPSAVWPEWAKQHTAHDDTPPHDRTLADFADDYTSPEYLAALTAAKTRDRPWDHEGPW